MVWKWIDCSCSSTELQGLMEGTMKGYWVGHKELELNTRDRWRVRLGAIFYEIHLSITPSCRNGFTQRQTKNYGFLALCSHLSTQFWTFFSKLLVTFIKMSLFLMFWKRRTAFVATTFQIILGQHCRSRHELWRTNGTSKAMWSLVKRKMVGHRINFSYSFSLILWFWSISLH